MKKILLFLSLFAMVFTSCETEEVDEIFNQSPEQRVSEQLNAVRTDLMSNEMGWLSTYTFFEGKEELVLLIKFIDETRAEISAPELDMKQESSYVLNYTQQVDLVFDSHSLLALLVDLGYKADFRWELDKQEDGQYFFKSVAGKTEGESELNMVKASPEKLASALKIQALKAKMKPNPSKSFFRNMELEGVTAKYAYSYVGGKVLFTTMKEGELVSFDSEVTINDNGFELVDPITIGDITCKSFKYNEDEESFVNESGQAKIIYDNAPAYTITGVYDEFMTTNFKSINVYSKALSGIVPSLKGDISEFSGFQMYVQWGYLLGYAPGHEGGNWAGFSAFAFNKAAEDQTIISWGMKAYGSWWGEIYGNNEAKLLLGFLTDPAGLYIVNAGNDTFYLISKTDPSMYILMG
jgi:hypothetical protein